MIWNKLSTIIFIGFLSILINSCGVYNLTGGSKGIAKTAAVVTFQNEALTKNPNMAQNLTEKIRDKIQRQTSLKIVSDTNEADLIYRGTITGYVTSPVAIQNDQASKTKLNVTINFSFRNKVEKDKNVKEDLNANALFDSNKTLFQVENALIEEINDNLVTQIFNKSLNNW